MTGAGVVQGMTPFLAEALGAYREGVLTEKTAAASPVADVGRQVLQTTYARVDERGREALEEAVREAVAEPGSEDAVGALRQVIRRALGKCAGLEQDLAALLPSSAPGRATVIVTGERAVGAGGSIGIAITGDGHVRP